VAFHKFSTVDGFVVIDLDGAPTSTGVVRCAPTILPGGAAELARTLTYSYATLGMQRGGASAGINARDDERDGAVAAFVAEVAPMVASAQFLPDAGKGVSDADLSPLRSSDPRTAVDATTHDTLVAAGSVAAAEHALGALDGRSVAIEGFAANSAPLVNALLERGAKVVAVASGKGCVADPAGIPADELAKGARAIGDGAAPAFTVFATECDAVFTGSKMGALDHRGAELVRAKAVVPTGPVPVTAKALAALRRAGVVTLPDFLVLAGPLLGAWGSADRTIAALSDEVVATVLGVLDEVSSHPDGPLLAACYRAEAFLQTWRDTLPFGRPLAA
jgi:glutamate dehydrogenase/leucine dehydrogenase